MFAISQTPVFKKAIIQAVTNSCSKLNKKNTNESFAMQKGGKAQTLISNLIINESATKKYHFPYFQQNLMPE
ncbi:hypothetical protein B4100_0358 [Heyndrickxia coagulans]|nr:hypothetical protein B4100_0358 [Heyndrickxia coagulans]